MAELDAVGIAAVLSADADLQFLAGLASLLDAPAHQHPYALDVERLEGIGTKNGGFLLIHVGGQEATRVLAGESHGGLCEIVGAEGKEVGDLGDLACEQRRTRELDHRSD